MMEEGSLKFHEDIDFILEKKGLENAKKYFENPSLDNNDNN